jgi:ferredoxin-NADP reductase
MTLTLSQRRYYRTSAMDLKQDHPVDGATHISILESTHTVSETWHAMVRQLTLLGVPMTSVHQESFKEAQLTHIKADEKLCSRFVAAEALRRFVS